MESRFRPAVTAIADADADAFSRIVEGQPDLAASRSSSSHPTLMQCLALEGKGLPPVTQSAMAQSLFLAGSAVDEPLIACASCGNMHLAAWLLDRGASLNGNPSLLRGWTAIEEALYWGHPTMVAALRDRGASLHNLRIASGVGGVEDVAGFFDASGNLRMPEAGPTNYPFDDEEELSSVARDVLDNALIYAALGGHRESVDFLLERGAAINALPPGFHNRGTALHFAAIRGSRMMCEFLVDRGADVSIEDPKFEGTPAGWAREGRHALLAAYLDGRAG